MECVLNGIRGGGDFKQPPEVATKELVENPYKNTKLNAEFTMITAVLHKNLGLDHEIEKIEQSPLEAKNFTTALSNYVNRNGKRIRPLLVINGYHAVLDQVEYKKILPVAISVENLHAYLLIHDDIMDGDDLRRGKPAFHKIFEDRAKKWGFRNPAKFGESAGIIGGDILSTWGLEHILNSNFTADAKVRALKVYNNMNKHTGFGQFFDVLYSNKPLKSVKEEDVLRVHINKTAKYTFEGPLHLGAVLGGATKSQLESLTNYAIPLGIAFQLYDDYLGLFGTEKKIGKPLYSDLKEGKKTLLTVKAFENGTLDQRKSILSALGNHNLTIKQGTEIKDIVVETGSLDYSRQKWTELKKASISSITNAQINSEIKQVLTDLAENMVDRRK